MVAVMVGMVKIGQDQRLVRTDLMSFYGPYLENTR